MRIVLFSIVCILASLHSFAQIKINEASYRNYTQITDENGENPDWIELYNAGTEIVHLNQYYLSDKNPQLNKWRFPNIILPPQQWLIVYATGRETEETGVHHWETAVLDDHIWHWINPDANTSANWMQPTFDDSSWPEGKGGFGFADNDDSTTFGSQYPTVYTRILFSISDTSKIAEAMLHVDCDDGFVAYLNGTEIARGNISQPVSWNTYADGSKEAQMYQGKNPESFELDMDQIRTLMIPGQNLLAVEAHNASSTSTDMSLRVFLSFGLIDAGSQFEQTPDWFSMQSDNGLQTNFKISSEGETIYLANFSGQIIDSLVLPANMPIDYSMGSVTDGSKERGTFIKATPNTSNNLQTAFTHGYEPSPVASFFGGYYPESIKVTLTSTSPSCQIRYTINGQTPKSNSTLYSGPINITTTKVLKAACFSTTDKMPSLPVTNTYIIGPEPTPAGILSITMENIDLYGATGIYDNYWTDWKKPCYIEYYEPENHTLAFKQNSGIKVEGGAGGSRSHPQRSFRLEPGNGSLGDGDVKYPLIPSRTERDSYERFYIRNGSNQYLYYPCKDAIETRCMGEGTYNTYAGYTPVQVYLNGKYWGYYELREKIDEDYFKQHYGTNPDSLEILSVSYWYNSVLRAVTGKDPITQFTNDYEKFLTLNTADEDYWEKANQLFDMTYYVDYICAQTWIADTDWPYNNIKIHRSPETNHSWRFSLIDLEWSLAPNGWTNSSFNHISYMRNYDSSYPYIHIWQKAMENKRFHDYFINRLADLMNTNWKADRLKAIADSIYDATRPELPATFEKWGDPSIPVDNYIYQFDDAHKSMLDELSKRSSLVRTHVKTNYKLPKTVSITLKVDPAEAGYIQISTVKPESYPWTGIYFDGVPVKIEVFAKHGYVFDHWDATPLITDVKNPVFNNQLKQSATFFAHFSDDSTSGRVTISEINYNSDPSIDAGDWIEFWNYSRVVSTDISGWYITDNDPEHKFIFPKNTILEPNERVVVLQDFMSFRNEFTGVNIITDLPFKLGNDNDAVKLYDANNNLVAEVNYADSSPWPLGANGKGRTLELKDPFNPTNISDNWFNGCIGGSPGSAYSPCNEPIVFSEINYHSDSTFNPGNWVELLNVSNATIDLSGWKFKDEVDSIGHTYILAQGTSLDPNEHLVLVQDVSQFTNLFPNITNYIGPFEFNLSNKGEWIRIYDKTSRLRQSVRYNDKLPWPILANGKGYTLELKDSKELINNGENWFAGCYAGSPGTHYTTPCSPIGVTDQAAKFTTVVYPNPFTNQLTIETGTTEEVTIQLYNFTGQLVYTGATIETEAVLDLSNLPNGFYLLNLIYKNGSKQAVRLIKQ